MKKYLKVILCLTIILSLFSFNIAYAKEDNLNYNSVTAHYASAMDVKTKNILFEKKAYELVPIASTTKIMTAIVAIHYGNLDKKIEISQKAASIRGSTVGYRKGEQITIKELLFGLMTRSGNDAAIAISEGISGSVDEYVKLMNEYALHLGLHNTHFESPHGLDSANHYSTAYDLAYLTCIAKENPLFNEIVGSKDVDASKYGFTRSYHNINKILTQLPGADGVKTGYTGGAGKCLVTSVKINGCDTVIVVLNCPDRWKQTIKISNFIKKNYTFKTLAKKGAFISKAKCSNGRELNLLCSDDIVIPQKTGCTYSNKIIIPKDISCTIKKGSKAGKMCFYENEKLIYTCPLIVENDSEKMKKDSLIKKWIKNIKDKF